MKLAYKDYALAAVGGAAGRFAAGKIPLDPKIVDGILIAVAVGLHAYGPKITQAAALGIIGEAAGDLSRRLLAPAGVSAGATLAATRRSAEPTVLSAGMARGRWSQYNLS